MYTIKDRNGTYYLRIILDEDARQRLGQREYRRSLGTKSVREARRKLPEAYMKALAEIQEGSTRKPVKKKTNKGILLSVFFDKAYTNHLHLINLRPKSIEDKRIILNILVFIVGDKAIQSYTREDARNFRDTALTLPPRVSSWINKGYTLKDICNMDTVKTITVSTVNNWVRNLSAMFDYAVKEGVISENVFKGLSITQRNIKPSSLRDAFTLSEVNTIIDCISDIYTNKDSKYWIVLIGAYSGMRLGEITQLYTDNIIDYKGVWCFYVTGDREDQHIKNLSSERIVPIHQYLLDMGFLTYVQHKQDRLFPDLKYTEFNGYRTGISKWFGNILVKLGIKDSSRKVSFHSFRHYVATELKNKSIPEHITAEILGHSNNNSITYGRYGKSIDIGVLKETVEKINGF